jgi:hypothetical protein
MRSNRAAGTAALRRDGGCFLAMRQSVGHEGFVGQYIGGSFPTGKGRGGRLRFGNGEQSAPFPSALAVRGPDQRGWLPSGPTCPTPGGRAERAAR